MVYDVGYMNRHIRITYFDGTNDHDLLRGEETEVGWAMTRLLGLPELQALLVDDKALHTLFFLGGDAAALQQLHRQRPMFLDPRAEGFVAYMDCDPGELVFFTQDGNHLATIPASAYGQISGAVLEGTKWLTLCALTRHARLHSKDPVPPTLEQLVVELNRCEKAEVSGHQIASAMGLEAPTTGQMRELAEGMRSLGWESFKTRTGTNYRKTHGV